MPSSILRHMLETTFVIEKPDPETFYTYDDCSHATSEANFILRHYYNTFDRDIGDAHGRDEFLWVDRISESNRLKAANHYCKYNAFVLL